MVENKKDNDSPSKDDLSKQKTHEDNNNNNPNTNDPNPNDPNVKPRVPNIGEDDKKISIPEMDEKTTDKNAK